MNLTNTTLESPEPPMPRPTLTRQTVIAIAFYFASTTNVHGDPLPMAIQSIASQVSSCI